MTIMNDIREALETKLAGGAGLPTAIYYPGVGNDPDPETDHLRVQLLPTSRRPAVRGGTPQHRYQGLFVVTVCTRSREGSGAALDYADTLLALFNGSTDVVGTSVTVSIDYSEASAPYMEEPFYCVPVNVAWYIYSL